MASWEDKEKETSHTKLKIRCNCLDIPALPQSVSKFLARHINNIFPRQHEELEIKKVNGRKKTRIYKPQQYANDSEFQVLHNLTQITALENCLLYQVWPCPSLMIHPLHQEKLLSGAIPSSEKLAVLKSPEK